MSDINLEAYSDLIEEIKRTREDKIKKRDADKIERRKTLIRDIVERVNEKGILYILDTIEISILKKAGFRVEDYEDDDDYSIIHLS